MAIENIDEPNPRALPSHIPDSANDLIVRLKYEDVPRNDLQLLQQARRAADYIAAAMIFLSDNTLVKRDLRFEDIKPRLLGHWGTCPGLSLVYSHLNYLIRQYDLDMMYIVGPGHGAPAVLAWLWLEGSLGKFYPQYATDEAGLHNLIAGFSTPRGFPSHVNAETPGCIHEGGELGYALSVAFGAVMDKPDLIVCAIIGDGEAETGPTATAWHGYKYIDPSQSGAVIPVVHVNGFKISERTIYGCMDNKELACLFSGYGYQARFVEDLANIDRDLANSLRWAYKEIRHIQKAARSGTPIAKPRWPVLIMRTPKGWGAPKKVHGELVEGSFRSHQVPLPAAKTDSEELSLLQQWLRSYHPSEILDSDGQVNAKIEESFPVSSKRLGQCQTSNPYRQTLDLQSWHKFAVPEGSQQSCLKVTGEFLAAAVHDNPHSLRIFSPDELVSNKLDAVFRHTSRNFQCDQYSRARGGQVVEILSEHTCQGFLQGYTMTGRTALFPTYESFLPIVTTMMVQFAKFRKVARAVNWRNDLNSITYISTSVWTRQEHNGLSHQNPGFIGPVLDLKPEIARVYLPPDANCFLSTFAHCLRSKNYVNLIVGSKQPQPVWLSPTEADEHCRAGGSVWKFASTDEGLNPDVVLVGIGADVMFEVVAAAALLRQMAPYMRVRVVNVTDLMILGPGHPHSLTYHDFQSLFTGDKHIHFNYHGYVKELQGLLFGRPQLDRVTTQGYQEEGTTTTPFDMVLRNQVSRYHVAIEAVRGAAAANERVRLERQSLLGELGHRIAKAREFIFDTGKDPNGTYDTPHFEA